MILFDDFGELLGSDAESLKLFECESIEEFKDKVKDVSDFFIKEDGYLYKFDHYNWIDFLNYSEEKINKVLIRQKDNRAIEAEISIKEIYNIKEINGSKTTFLIDFSKKRVIEQIIDKNLVKENIETKEDIEEATQKISTENIELNKIELNYNRMKEECDVDEDFYNELLHDFIIESKSDLELINAYIINNKYSSILRVINKLKNICLNLKLNAFLPVLGNIEKNIRNKNYDNIEKFLEIYIQELNMLSRYIR